MMRKSEFIIQYARERVCLCSYQEAPTGEYDYMLACPEEFLSLLNYTIGGLKKFNLPVDRRNLENWFCYYLEEVGAGRLAQNADGRWFKVKTENDQAMFRRMFWQTAKSYIKADDSQRA